MNDKTYHETEFTELWLYSENDRKTYDQIRHTTLKLLSKYHKQNKYDKDKAIKQWLQVVKVAAINYCKEFCTPDIKYNKVFNLSCRKAVARELEQHWFNEFELGNYTE